MAQYQSYYVDEKYSAILDPNLFGDSIFQPGITFNPQYQGDAAAGAVKIYKLDSSAVKQPGVPGADFSDEAAGNQLIPLAINNSFDKSKKILGVQAAAVQFNMGEQHLALAVRENARDWNTAALACIAKEGTDYGDYTALTKSNIKSYIINARKANRDAFANANVIICSTATYAAMLDAAGTEYTPMFNDDVIRSGQIGRWLGMIWVEANLLNNEIAAYRDYSDTLQVVDLTDVDFIMYDWESFNIVTNYELLRIKDSERFPGSLAQNVINSGFRVPNSARVLVKKNALLETLTVVSAAGSSSGDTALTVTPTILSGHTYVYKTDATTAPAVVYDQDLSSGWTAWDGSADITATTGHKITVAEIDASSLAKKAGNTTVASLA